MGRLRSVERWLLIGAILSMALPLVALLIFFDSLPHRIAIFHELSGTVTVWSNRTVLTVGRLPLMGFAAQCVALGMVLAGSKLSGHVRESTVQLWVTATWVIFFKWGLESVEAALAAANSLQPIVAALNWAALAVTGSGLAILCVLGLRIWHDSRALGSFKTDLRATFSTGIGITVALAMTAYVALAVFPLVGK